MTGLETMKLPELRKLAAEVAAEVLLRESARTGNTNQQSLYHEWYFAVRNVMKEDHHQTLPPLAVFSRTGLHNIFKTALPSCERLVSEFQKHKGPVLRKYQDQNARIVILRALMVWIEKRDLEISLRVVCCNRRR